MKAVILAGGRGTRLEPYTTVFPKPLVPIEERPIIDIIMRQLSYYGIQDIILSVGYLAELIQSYFHNGRNRFSNISISYVREDAPTGTAGALGLLPEMADTFLVMNGDILTTLNYSKLVEFHKSKKAAVTIGTYKKEVKIDLGVINVDQDGYLLNYDEKPTKNYLVSMGVYVYEPHVLSYIKPGEYLDFPDLILRLLENREKVASYSSNDFWLDIGRHEDYALAQKTFASMREQFLPGEKS